MTKAYGHKFISNYGTKDDGIWLLALKGFTREDLEYGFEKLLTTVTEDERKKQEAWPPNAKEFRMYCERRLKDFDLPEAHEAFAEVLNNNYFSRWRWSHPLIETAQKMIKKDQKDYVTDEDYPNFRVIYFDLCQRFMRGEGMNLLNS